jgi:hypothetical protein
MTTLQELDARVRLLEARHGLGGSDEVDGWEAVARVLQKSRPTVKALAKRPDFPRPVRIKKFRRGSDDQIFTRPTYRRAELLNYRNT